MRNAYEILQVAESVSTEIAELVYKRLAFNDHPDRAKSKGKEKAEARLKDVNWAIGVISDPEKRAAHDLELRASRALATAPTPAIVVLDCVSIRLPATEAAPAPAVAAVPCCVVPLAAATTSIPAIATCTELPTSIVHVRDAALGAREK